MDAVLDISQDYLIKDKRGLTEDKYRHKEKSDATSLQLPSTRALESIKYQIRIGRFSLSQNHLRITDYT